MQEIDSLSSNDSTVVGIDQNGTTISLPVEALERAGQTGRWIESSLSSSSVIVLL